MALEFWMIALIVAGSILGVLVFIWLMCEVDSRRRRKRSKKEFERQVYEQEKNRAEATLATLRAANIERARAPMMACPHGDFPCCGDSCSTSCAAGHGDYPSGPGYCPECYPHPREGMETSPGYPYPPSGYPPPQQYELAARPLYPPGNYNAQMPPNAPLVPAASPPAIVSWGAMGAAPHGTVMQQGPAAHGQETLQCVGVIPTTSPPPPVTYAAASPAYQHYPPGPIASPVGGTSGQGRLRLAENDHELPTSPPPVAPPGFVTVPMVLDRS